MEARIDRLCPNSVVARIRSKANGSKYSSRSAVVDYPEAPPTLALFLAAFPKMFRLVVVAFFSAWFIASGTTTVAKESKKQLKAVEKTEEGKSIWTMLHLPMPKPDALYAKPPVLESQFEDDVSADTRGNYQICGKDNAGSWEAGKVLIGKKEVVKRALDTGGWLDMQADSQFPEPNEAIPKSDLPETERGPRFEAAAIGDIYSNERTDGETVYDLLYAETLKTDAWRAGSVHKVAIIVTPTRSPPGRFPFLKLCPSTDVVVHVPKGHWLLLWSVWGLTW